MPYTIKPPLPSRTLAFAKHLRHHGTDAEIKLWYHLRAKRFQGAKWRRQHPLPPHIVDFYCHAARLVVELDGGQHSVPADSKRTIHIESQGFLVLRFWNYQVLRETEAVLEAIFEIWRDRTLSPGPHPGHRFRGGVRETAICHWQIAAVFPRPVGRGEYWGDMR